MADQRRINAGLQESILALRPGESIQIDARADGSWLLTFSTAISGGDVSTTHALMTPEGGYRAVDRHGESL